MKLALVDVYDNNGVAHPSFERMLYELLRQRDMRYALSHEKMPDYGKHQKFVAKHPYKAWYIIFDRDLSDYVGAIYLSERNEIGVYVRKAHQGEGIGKWAVNELMRIHGKLRYFFNVNPENHVAFEFLEAIGVGRKVFQITIEKDMRE